ncbi:hypothetical protein ACHHV8_27665 [Paenibacillus sp. TAB 01]|uniref:hypothetical protein n=1 Tax=Paenibacillus sp. TAB 01 TaxID=3368988 RepID=UPI003751F2A6
MVITIALAFACMFLYQLHLYKRFKTTGKSRRIILVLYGFSLIYCISVYYSASWVNPNPVILALFKPVQDWILFKQ